MSIYGRENISDLLFDSYKPGMLISTDVLKIVHEKIRNIQYLTQGFHFRVFSWRR